MNSAWATAFHALESDTYAIGDFLREIGYGLVRFQGSEIPAFEPAEFRLESLPLSLQLRVDVIAPGLQ
jgi:hypothetical protein